MATRVWCHHSHSPCSCYEAVNVVNHVKLYLTTWPATVMKHDTLATRVWCRVRMRGNTPRDLTQPRAALTRPVLQVVNIPSFIVRLDSQKHIDFSLKSPFGGGR